MVRNSLVPLSIGEQDIALGITPMEILSKRFCGSKNFTWIQRLLDKVLEERSDEEN